MGHVLDQQITDQYAIYNGDCMEVMPSFPDGSIHLSVYSPPFAGMYHYTSSGARSVKQRRLRGVL